MRVSKWYQEPTRENDDPRSSSSSRVSDVITGTNRMSYQVREPTGNDEERLSMKRGDTPPAAPEDEFTQTWFEYGRSVFPQSVTKTGTKVELYNLSTYGCSIIFKNMGSFSGRVNSGDQRT